MLSVCCVHVTCSYHFREVHLFGRQTEGHRPDGPFTGGFPGITALDPRKSLPALGQEGQQVLTADDARGLALDEDDRRVGGAEHLHQVADRLTGADLRQRRRHVLLVSQCLGEDEDQNTLRLRRMVERHLAASNRPMSRSQAHEAYGYLRDSAIFASTLLDVYRKVSGERDE